MLNYLKMKKNQQLSWDDYLFENRNKAYGAYVLRTGEGENLLKSLMVTVFFIGILVAVFSFTTKNNEIIADAEPPIIIHKIDKLVDPSTPEPPKSVAPKVIPVATVDKEKSDFIPQPKEKPIVETPMSEQKDIGKLVMPNVGKPAGDGSIKSNGNQGTSGEGEDTGNKQPEIKPEVNKTFNARDVSKMAVFPGCENAGTTKKALQDCMAEKLQNELGIQLSDFGEIANRNNIGQANAKIYFVVDKQGKIIEVKALNGGNQEFSKEAQQAMKRISDRLVKKGKYLKPAELEDGTKVNMTFTIPVQYLIQ